MQQRQYRRKTDRIRLKRREQYSGVRGFLILYLKQLQRYLITGLLVWVPLIITLWVSWLVISKLGFGIERLIAQVVGWINSIGEDKPRLQFLTIIQYRRGLGILFALLLFLTTGFLTRYLAWRKIMGWGEYLVGLIPGINRVYVASQQIRDVFVNRKGAVFQEVVLLEYPRPGVIVVGFVTSREQGMLQETLGTKLVAVFVPTTPNPTSGFLLYVPPTELTPFKISVEDAMKLIVSGGAYLPGLPDIEKIATKY